MVDLAPNSVWYVLFSSPRVVMSDKQRCRKSFDRICRFALEQSDSRFVSQNFNLYFSPNQSIVDIPFLVDCPRTVITFKRWHFKYGPDNVQIWRLTGGGGGGTFLFCTAPLPRPVRGRAEGLSFREQWIYTRQ